MFKFLSFLLAIFICCSSWCKDLRIVSLSPAISEIICSLEGKKYLVGRSRVCDTPAITSLPVAGDLGFPFPEAILALRATHVITDINHPQANWDFLRKSGIQVIVFSTEKLNNYPEILKRIGKLIHQDELAKKEIFKFQKELREIEISKPHSSVNLLILLGLHPLISCQAGSFLDEIITLAGGRNCTSKSGFKNRYFIITPEFIFKTDPDVILLLTNEPNAIEFFQRTPWNKLKAVKTNQVISNIKISELGRLSPRTTTAIKMFQKEISKLPTQTKLLNQKASMH